MTGPSFPPSPIHPVSVAETSPEAGRLLSVLAEGEMGEALRMLPNKRIALDRAALDGVPLIVRTVALRARYAIMEEIFRVQILTVDERREQLVIDQAARRKAKAEAAAAAQAAAAAATDVAGELSDDR